jgi:hypothetical protein
LVFGSVNVAERAKSSGRQRTRPVTSFFDAARSTPGDQLPVLSKPKYDQPSDLISSRHTDLALSGSESLMAQQGKSDGHENAKERDQFRPKKWVIALVAVAMAIPWVTFQKLADTTGRQIVESKQTATETASVVTRQSGETLPARDPVKESNSDLTPDYTAAVTKSDGQGAPAPAQALAAMQNPAKLLKKEELAILLKKGRYLLSIGDIAPARLLLERAADANDASAAFDLAGTYDPAVLTRSHVSGISPDIAMARMWYEKALNLGHSEAQQRLAQLQK